MAMGFGASRKTVFEQSTARNRENWSLSRYLSSFSDQPG